MLVIIVVLASTTAYMLSSRQSPIFEAQSRLILSDPRSNVGMENPGPVEPGRSLQNQVERVTSRPVLDRAKDEIDTNTTVDSIVGRVSAEASPDSDVLVVRARGHSGEEAAQLANAVATAYQDAVAADVAENAQAAVALLTERQDAVRERVRRLDRRAGQARRDGEESDVAAERQLLTQQVVELQSRMDGILVEASLYGSGVEIFETARAPSVPVEPNPLRDAAIAAIVSVAVGGAFFWWRAIQGALGDESLNEVLDGPSLGVMEDLPSTDALIRLAVRGSAAADRIQLMVSALDRALSRRGDNCVLITSALAQEGKSTVAVNLAVAAAQDGRRVAVVDAVYGPGGVTESLGIGVEPGLTELADDNVAFSSCVRRFRLSEGVVAVPVSRLTFVPPGRAIDEPAAFFRTSAFRKAIKRVQETADLVLVDTRSLLSSAEAATIASFVDGVVLVVGTASNLHELQQAQERLRTADAKALGHILNLSAHRGLTVEASS